MCSLWLNTDGLQNKRVWKLPIYEFLLFSSFCFGQKETIFFMSDWNTYRNVKIRKLKFGLTKKSPFIYKINNNTLKPQGKNFILVSAKQLYQNLKTILKVKKESVDSFCFAFLSW